MENVSAVLDHERLKVYQLSLDLVAAVDRFAPHFDGMRRHLRWQLHRAATSVPLNIAESSGRFRRKDKAQFLVIATGSAYEWAAIMDIAQRLEVGTASERAHIRDLLVEIIRMLIGLTKSVRGKNRL